MTAPISFPTLAPPQAVRRNSSLDGLAELLLGISQHRQQIALERERLDLDRQRTEAQVAESGERTAGAAADRKQRQQEFEQKQQALEASDIAESEVGNMLQLGGITPARMNDARTKLMERSKGTKLSPSVLLGALDAAVQRNEETFGKIAQRSTSESTARVANATEGTVVSRAGTDAETAKVQLDNAKLERTARVLQTQGFDAQRLAGAQDYARTSGLPWGVVRKQFGLPFVQGGIPDVFTFPAATTASSAATEQAAQQLRLANDGINALGNKGLSAASYASLSAGNWTAAGINALSSKEQQELAAAYSQFIAPIQAVLVKGAASDKDVQRMQRAYVTLDSDATEVRAQKALVRTALAESFNANSTDYEGMLNKFESIIKEYRIPRNSPSVAPFLAMRPKLKALDKAKAAPNADDPTVAALLKLSTSKAMPPR